MRLVSFLIGQAKWRQVTEKLVFFAFLRAEVEAKIKKRKKKSAQASKLSFAEDLDEDEQAGATEAGASCSNTS